MDFSIKTSNFGQKRIKIGTSYDLMIVCL